MMVFAWQTNAGKRSSGHRAAKATLSAPVNRYRCGLTVGAGWYKDLEGTDPVGAQCSVYGAWVDGRIMVNLPRGGCATLGAADVTLTDLSDLTPEERDFLAALPPVSRVRAGEILAD
jgi:hypothetical protein